MKLRKVTLEQVQACKFRPEAHTVAFNESEGQYYALVNDSEDICSVLRVRIKGSELYIGEVYTRPEDRRKGLCEQLVRTVSDFVYAGYSITAHCLKSSRGIFERCGYAQYSYRPFKYGEQFWMRRSGKKYCKEKV